MKTLVTGVNGQLGHDVMLELSKRGYEAIGCGSSPKYRGMADEVAKMPYVSLDITDDAAVDKVLQDVKPDCICHCAAWTAVDAAEEPENK
uniref:sugar nucleotide-binding protein n=1 Tax=Acidaminococcus timonensis TaxID=1871002 RepID=UPI0026F0ACBE